MMMDVEFDKNPRLDREMALTDNISTNVRACATCRQTIRDSRFKNCTTCREKNRNKNRLAAQRRQERNLWAMKALAGLSDEEGDGSGGEENHAMGPAGAPPAKKRKPKSILELDGKERDVALLEMKNGLKRKLGKKMVAPPSKVILYQFVTRVVIKNFYV
jgi:hypothetical protein